MGQTVVMVTHDPVAASYADRVVFLRDGGFVLLAGAAGTVAAVMPARRAAKTSIVESLAHD